MSNTSWYLERRLRLADLLPGIPVLLSSGCARTRNYAAATYPFRANSHYLYFGAPQEPKHLLLIINGDATLYRAAPDVDDAVWHGAAPSDDQLIENYGFVAVKDFSGLEEDLVTLGHEEVLSVPSSDPASNEFLKRFLGRIPTHEEDPDVDLVDALIECRLRHDEGGQERLRQAALETVRIQKTIMRAATPGTKETALRGLLDFALSENGSIASFQPIISTCGEVLHNPYYRGTLVEGDLLLVDCGAELNDGWSGDLTRVIPVSGKFSPTQRALYDVVNEARRVGVEGVAPDVSFLELHLQAARALTAGLVNLKILKGDPDDLVEKGVHALFFPHGLGHIVGIDVHDMEDLGDLAGYEEGEERSEQFGLSNLRLTRTLEAGMAVTIEPGFYQIPALLDGPLGQEFQEYVDRDELAKYSDVRGIRLEDMVLVTDDGGENLSESLPVDPDQVENLLAQR